MQSKQYFFEPLFFSLEFSLFLIVIASSQIAKNGQNWPTVLLTLQSAKCELEVMDQGPSQTRVEVPYSLPLVKSQAVPRLEVMSLGADAWTAAETAGACKERFARNGLRLT